MIRKLQLIALFIFSSLIAQAQKEERCCAHSKLKTQLESDEQFIVNRAQIEKEISKILNGEEKGLEGSTLVIPVVFHIIHNGDPIGVQENLSDALIAAQLQQLNEDFSGDNSNFNQTPQAFQADASNMDIQFCLTELDPNGLQTEGINRYHINTLSGVSEADCWTPDYIDQNIVRPTIWDRDNFLNVYTVIAIDELVNSQCNYFSHLGYSQFPGGPADTDAVVTGFYSFGSLDMVNPLVPEFMGRTLTHEVGHWLNLAHVWGEQSGGCVDDDNVMDTPSQFQASSGCPNFPSYDACTTAGNGVMFMNFMDYSDDACMTMFTAGQRDRVQASVSASRPSLFTAPCASQSVLSLLDNSDFTAVQKNNDVMLNWKSSTIASGTYYVEHRMDKEEWYVLDEIEIISSNKNEDFNYLHNRPQKGLHYYRINHESNDGTINRSEIKSVLIDKTEQSLIFPIPSTDQINIINPFDSKEFRVEVFTISGEKVSDEMYNGIMIQKNISNLASGIYYMTISNIDNITHLKWIKS